MATIAGVGLQGVGFGLSSGVAVGKREEASSIPVYMQQNNSFARVRVTGLDLSFFQIAELSAGNNDVSLMTLAGNVTDTATVTLSSVRCSSSDGIIDDITISGGIGGIYQTNNSTSFPFNWDGTSSEIIIKVTTAEE